MGELRDRMVRDMEVRHFSGRTVEAYVAGVKGLAQYYRRAPDALSDAEVQRYLLHLREERKLSGSTGTQIRCARKFFYEVTVRRPHASLTVPPMRREQKLPEILSRAEVERVLDATRTLRERGVGEPEKARESEPGFDPGVTPGGGVKGKLAALVAFGDP